MILTHFMLFLVQPAVEIVPAAVRLPVAAGPSAIIPAGTSNARVPVLRVGAAAALLRVGRA